jgi:hypothetical protein
MKPGIHSMKKHYNSWREKPLAVPVAISAQGILRNKNTRNISNNACRGACGSECKTPTCVSCKAG